MKQKKLIISLIVCTLGALGCDLGNGKEPDRTLPPMAISKLNFEGEKVVKPGIFTDCTYGLKQSISDHAPVIYGTTGTWNIAGFANHQRQYPNLPSFPGFFIHKFKAITDLGAEDGTLIDSQGNQALVGEKGEGSDSMPNKYYALRLTALAKKIKQLFNDKSLNSLALQEIPSNQADSDGINSLDHFKKELLPLVLIPSKEEPDVGLVVKEGSKMVPHSSSKALRAQAYCDDATKACVISTHIAGRDVLVKGKPSPKKLKLVCEKLEAFAETLNKSQFQDIKYLGDFNISAQQIKKACRWYKAPLISSYEGEGASCSDNAGKLSNENIDISLEFNYKN